MRNIQFEKYTAQEYVATFGDFYVITAEVRKLKRNNLVWMCLEEVYEDGALLDVFNTGYTILALNDNKAYAVYYGKECEYVGDYDGAKGYVMQQMTA